MNAIEVSGLRKSFGKTVALDGLDLSVAAGEVHGFLGPNGAGKTTTIRVLLGLLRSDGGTARLLGGDPWREAVALHRRLAYVPGDVTLWPNPDRRRGHRSARAAARRPGRQAAGRAAGAVRARPDEEGAGLLQGQPAEGCAGGGSRFGRRAAPAGRADVRARPADGGDVPAVRRGGTVSRPHDAAVQPHPVRGRGPLRPGDDHPGRADRRDRAR